MSEVPRRHGWWMFLAGAAGLPALVVAVLALGRAPYSFELKASLIVVVVGFWGALLVLSFTRSRFHLLTLANLVAALREGDYSFRMRGASRNDAFGQVVAELNDLADCLRRQRVDDLEASALVRRVMGEIDVAVFAFDSLGMLRQANQVGRSLVGPDAVGRSAAELGLGPCLESASARTLELEIDGRRGRWEMRRGSFRQHGRPHRLVVLSDVGRALRAEELDAWRRLIRVMGHELNNSLAPIRSLADSTTRLLARDPLPDDWREDALRGLDVIGTRAAALGRFMDAYSRLAKMPEPMPVAVDVGSVVQRIAALETRVPVVLEPGPPVVIQADQDQIEQLLINLVRNAAEASLETGGEVSMSWEPGPDELEIVVADRGPGLASTDNLFVPFFTTKAEGSGIGLFLCRLVAEAHGGAVELANRSDGRGCRATVRLPLQPGSP